MTRFTWSPIIFDGGIREQARFLRADWCALDFDDGEMTLDRAVNNVFADCIRVIGTTKSHQKLKAGVRADRFRVLLKFERPITSLDEYRATMVHYIEHHGADPACKDGARFFWPCQEIVDISTEGYTQEIFAAPPRPVWTPKPCYRELGVIRRRSTEALRSVFPRGEKNNRCFMIAKDMFDAGFEFDEILECIIKSPTYKGVSSRELIEEISQCIRSGIKSIKEGRAYGGCDGSQSGTQEKS